MDQPLGEWWGGQKNLQKGKQQQREILLKFHKKNSSTSRWPKKIVQAENSTPLPPPQITFLMVCPWTKPTQPWNSCHNLSQRSISTQENILWKDRFVKCQWPTQIFRQKKILKFQLLTMIYLATCMWCAPLFKQYIFHRIVIILLKYKIDKLINWLHCLQKALIYTTCVFLQKREAKLIDYSLNPTTLNLLTSQRILLVTPLYS